MRSPARSRRLLDDPGMLGARARDLAMSKRGVVDRIAEEVWTAAAKAYPIRPARCRRASFSRRFPGVGPPAIARTSRAQLAQRRSLSTPVISIGGLTMGGSGKSPMVAHLAHRLREQGRNPAILTRGYHRKSHDRWSSFPAERKRPTELTGDEAQMYIRAGDAHVGIGAGPLRRRPPHGAKLSRPDIFVLDDGFQHRPLGADP